MAPDDESGPEVTLPFTLDLRGRRFSSLRANDNGNVTFDGPLPTFTPEPPDAISPPIVAAWFADVDTRGAGSQPIRYGSRLGLFKTEVIRRPGREQAGCRPSWSIGRRAAGRPSTLLE